MTFKGKSRLEASWSLTLERGEPHDKSISKAANNDIHAAPQIKSHAHTVYEVAELVRLGNTKKVEET